MSEANERLFEFISDFWWIMRSCAPNNPFPLYPEPVRKLYQENVMRVIIEYIADISVELEFSI